MAYCVHCGVKLGDSEKRCPLCGTAVLDPAEPRDGQAPKPYPVRSPEQELKRNKQVLLVLAAIVTLIPAGLCVIIDWLDGGGIFWSFYAASALCLLFIAVDVPLIVTHHRWQYSIGTAFLCLNAFLFIVDLLATSRKWFFPIALPAISLLTAMLLTIILLYRKGRLNKLSLLAAALAAVGAECLFIEWLYILEEGKRLHFIWSPIVMAPCLFIALALFYINSNRALREEVRRRVHF